ncbi:MAG: hypothetical protein ACE5D3_05565 [Candidatus Binatia bacterium]
MNDHEQPRTPSKKERPRRWVRVEIIGGKAKLIGKLGRVLVGDNGTVSRVGPNGWKSWKKCNVYLRVTLDSGFTEIVHQENVKVLHELEQIVEELKRPEPPPKLEEVDEDTEWDGWKEPPETKSKKRERKPDDPPRLEDL